MHTTTPLSHYQPNWWNKATKAERTESKWHQSANAFLPRLTWPTKRTDRHRDATPKLDKATTDLIRAKPAQVILKALAMGQQLFRDAKGQWYLLRRSAKNKRITKHVKAKWVQILEELRALTWLIPNVQMGLRKDPVKEHADTLNALAAKSMAKASA